MSSHAKIIEAVSLTKRFGSAKHPVQALAGLDLTARAGQVTAVLGPNGAGKSTLVRAVATLLRPMIVISAVFATLATHRFNRS